MSVTMQDVWAARERHEDFRRFAVKRQSTLDRPEVGSGLNMADRMSGIKAWLDARLARYIHAARDSLGRRNPLVGA
jgi:hypothetical protein